PPPEEEGAPLRCALTTALGLDEQCSTVHLALIERWFKRGLPAFGTDAARQAEILRSDGYKFLCYRSPSPATHPSYWGPLQVEVVGDRVTVHAGATWSGTGRAEPSKETGLKVGDYRTVTVFRMLPDRVEVLSDELEEGDVFTDQGPVSRGCKAEPVRPE